MRTIYIRECWIVGSALEYTENEVFQQFSWHGDCREVGIDAENDIGYMDHSNYSAIGKEILINNWRFNRLAHIGHIGHFAVHPAERKLDQQKEDEIAHMTHKP